jgi:hypothetical protein
MSWRERAMRAIGAYAGIGAISTAAAFVLLQLWNADLRVPFSYGGDTFVTAMMVKSIIDHGWYLNNPQLGGPSGLHLHDFPVGDVAHLALFRFMSLFSGDWALLINLYYLLGFPLIAMSAAAVFRQFAVRWGPAIVGSLLYAFLPSRLLKGEAHLFLDVFYQVPLGLLVALWVCGDAPPLLRDGPTERRPALDLRSPRSIAAIAICVLMGTTGIYYAFFTAFLMVSGGVLASVERRSPRNALAGIALAGIVIATIATVTLPTTVYRMKRGPNPQVAAREPGEAETLGMKMAQLLLPSGGHRLPGFRQLTKRYNATAPLVNENSSTSLGVIGGAGFLALLGLLLVRSPPRAPRQDPRGGRSVEPDAAAPLRPLAVLNLLAFLLATIGGLGSLVALLITPNIRTYSRMNVVIDFLALFAVVILLDRFSRRHKRLAIVALPIILVGGLLDQATPAAVPDYAADKTTYAADAAYFRRIEERVPPRGLIFELPYESFPEAGPINRMDGYDQIRPYLHTRTLRWSFPAMRGRNGDAWVQNIAALDPDAMVELLSDAGAAGILIDRLGYAVGDATVEKAVRALLGQEPLVSADEQLAFFELGTHDRRAHAGDAPKERERRREAALYPLIFIWGAGCYELEGGGAGGPFHWCSHDGRIDVHNDSRFEREATIQMTMSPANSGARMTISGDLISLPAIKLEEGGTPFSRVIKVPPGVYTIRFHCDGEPARAPDDPRTMVWRASKIVLSEAFRPAPAPAPAPVTGAAPTP